MIGKLVFEIPIYRLSQDDYSKETKTLLDKYLRPDEDNPMTQLGGFSEDDRNKWIKKWSDKFYNSYNGKIWKYNDIVGFIGLFAGKNQIKAEYWYVSAKRLNRKMKYKEFKYKAKLFDVWTNDRESSKDIYQNILSSLSMLSSHSLLKKRYIDLEVFENLSRYIDWRELTNKA